MGEVVEIMKFEGAEMMAHPSPEHGKVLSTADVAKGYGCAEGTIRRHLQNHTDELVEGKHFITVHNLNSNPKAGVPHQKTFWTPRGVMRLGMFIKSDRAKRFRDWAEDVLLSEVRTAKQPHSLREASSFLRSVGTMLKGLGLSKAESLNVLNHYSKQELGYGIDGVLSEMKEIEKTSREKDEEFVAAIKQRNGQFFRAFCSDENMLNNIDESLRRKRIGQPLVNQLYRMYVGCDDMTAQSISKILQMVDRRTFGETLKVGGLKVYEVK